MTFFSEVCFKQRAVIEFLESVGYIHKRLSGVYGSCTVDEVPLVARLNEWRHKPSSVICRTLDAVQQPSHLRCCNELMSSHVRTDAPQTPGTRAFKQQKKLQRDYPSPRGLCEVGSWKHHTRTQNFAQRHLFIFVGSSWSWCWILLVPDCDRRWNLYPSFLAGDIKAVHRMASPLPLHERKRLRRFLKPARSWSLCFGVILEYVVPRRQIIESGAYIKSLKTRSVSDEFDRTKVLRNSCFTMHVITHVWALETPSQNLVSLCSSVHATAPILLVPISICSERWRMRRAVQGLRTTMSSVRWGHGWWAGQGTCALAARSHRAVVVDGDYEEKKSM
jgi:hypothetical protein